MTLSNSARCRVTQITNQVTYIDHCQHIDQLDAYQTHLITIVNLRMQREFEIRQLVVVLHLELAKDNEPTINKASRLLYLLILTCYRKK